jgi:hypothetical protein
LNLFQGEKSICNNFEDKGVEKNVPINAVILEPLENVTLKKRDRPPKDKENDATKEKISKTTIVVVRQKV